MSENTNDVEVYVNRKWGKARDYQRKAYEDFTKERPSMQKQMYYVSKGFIIDGCMKKIYPGIVKIDKKDAKEASNDQDGVVIWTMMRDRDEINFVRDDGSKIAISDNPNIKKRMPSAAPPKDGYASLQIPEDEYVPDEDRKAAYLAKLNADLDNEVDEMHDLTNGGRRKNSKKTNKNKRRTRRTRRARRARRTFKR